MVPQNRVLIQFSNASSGIFEAFLIQSRNIILWMRNTHSVLCTYSKFSYIYLSCSSLLVKRITESVICVKIILQLFVSRRSRKSYFITHFDLIRWNSRKGFLISLISAYILKIKGLFTCLSIVIIIRSILVYYTIVYIECSIKMTTPYL